MFSNLSVTLSVDTQLLLVYSRRFQMARNVLLVSDVQIISNATMFSFIVHPDVQFSLSQFVFSLFFSYFGVL